MHQRIKYFLKPLYRIVPRRIKTFYDQVRIARLNNEQLLQWHNNGKPIPPPHIVKQRAIQFYQRTYGQTIFVETGTFLGDMVKAQLANFQKIYSIELSEVLWKQAAENFSQNKHVEILQGDSGSILKNLVPKIDKTAIFWLDGHYSEGVTARGVKDCPILEELAAIFLSRLNHILLIDDARCFNGVGDYPSINELQDFIRSSKPGCDIQIEDDIIRIRL